MEKVKLATLDVSLEMIECALHFPAGHSIVDADVDVNRNVLRFTITGPTLPDAANGGVPHVSGVVHRDADSVRLEFCPAS